MATEEKQHIKTIQWHYCSICRRNHDEGKKHKYSKHHKNKLEQIMNKFSKKVRSARRTLTKPSVMEGELEPGAKMWCYCCEQEIKKHVTNGNVSIEWGGLVEHLSDSTHHKKARHFWWVNGAEQTQLQAFLLFPIEYRRYKELVDEALKKLEEKRENQVNQVAEQLRVKEQIQLALVLETPSVSSYASTDHQRARGGQNNYWNGGDTSLTVSKATKPSFVAHAPSTRGNVHTGATPPWLREEDSDDGGSGHVSSIGPSLEEFIKHKERLRHAGKNPKRVGADFHLKLALQGRQQDSGDEDDDWLPSFGRVWNHGPRLHSKNEFLRELETKKARPSHTSSTGSSITLNNTGGKLASDHQAISSSTTDVSYANIKPYVRKRVIKLTKASNLQTITTDGRANITSESTETIIPSFDGAHLKLGTSHSSLPKIKPYVRKRARSRHREAEKTTPTHHNGSVKIHEPMESPEMTGLGAVPSTSQSTVSNTSAFDTCNYDE